jgi:Domain of unknown function (DUF4234)
MQWAQRQGWSSLSGDMGGMAIVPVLCRLAFACAVGCTDANERGTMSTLDQPTGQPAHPPVPPLPTNYAPSQYGQQSQYGQPQYAQPQYGQPSYAQPQYGQPHAGGYLQPTHVPAAPSPYGQPMGPVGKVRSTWAVIGLSVITLGIYSLYYYFATHEEMKQHSGEGLGGAIGLVLGIFTGGLVTAFVLPNEIGNLYARQGRSRPVSATTGLWMVLGAFILIGPLVWLVKTNGALNAYWRSVGAR